jgi:hypothetical protein
MKYGKTCGSFSVTQVENFCNKPEENEFLRISVGSSSRVEDLGDVRTLFGFSIGLSGTMLENLKYTRYFLLIVLDI